MPGPSRGGLAALITLGTAGVCTFLAMPVIAAALANSLGYTQRQVGLFSTVQLISLSIGCVISVFLPRGRIRRHGLAALAVMLCSDCASILVGAGSWGWFLFFRALGGCAGGIAVSQATGGMALTANSERSFGLFLALQTLVSILCVYALPPLVAHFGFGGSYAVLLALDGMAGLLVATALRDDGAAMEIDLNRGGNDAVAWLRCSGLLVSILCFFVGVGALWTYLALLGQGRGLGPDQVATAITVSKLVAFAASFLPGLLRIRIGRMVPILAMLGLLCAAVQLFAHGTGLAPFVAAAGLFSFGWYVLYPFQLSALAEADRDGRPMLASAALTGIGLGLGPAIAMAVSSVGTSGIFVTATLSFIASALAAMLALVPMRLPSQRLAGDAS